MTVGEVRGRLGQHAPLLAALLAAAVLVGYVRTGFLLDDAFFLARASHRFGSEVLDFALRTTDHRIHLWVHEEPVVFQFFRPLSSLSFWIERRMWDSNPWGYHLTNVILHLVNAGLLWRLAMRSGLERGAALLGVLAWALGVQTIAAVGWISGRTEVLWCGCALLAIHALLRWRDGGGAAWFCASLLAAGLSACAKEGGLIAPLLALLVAQCAPPARPGAVRRVLRPRHWALMLLPAVIVLGLRISTIGFSIPPEPYLDVPRGALETLWTTVKPVLYLSAGYLSLPLSHWGPLEWMRTHTWSLALVLPVGLAATVMLARAAGALPRRLWLGWFAIALLPVMPVRPTSLYLYVPMMGIAMLVAAAFQQTRQVAFATWLAVTAIAGSGAHLFTQRYIGEQWQTSRVQVATIDRWLRARATTRLIAIDTPVWLYALPASIEMTSPELRFETWFVNFRPRLNAIEGSAVRWRNALEFEIEAPAGGFLHSTFERFLAFGGAPPERPGPTTRPVEVTIEGPRSNPTRLVVSFQDGAVRDSALIVRFTHDGIRLIEPTVPPVPDAADGPAPPSVSDRKEGTGA